MKTAKEVRELSRTSKERIFQETLQYRLQNIGDRIEEASDKGLYHVLIRLFDSEPDLNEALQKEITKLGYTYIIDGHFDHDTQNVIISWGSKEYTESINTFF